MLGGLDPNGPVAREIADLWWLMFWMGLALFVVFMAALAWAVWKSRSEPDGDEPPTDVGETGSDDRYVRRWILGLGVVMTTVTLTIVLVFTIISMRAIPGRADDDALRLDLTAHQWYWEVRYPDDGPTTRDVVRIPAGQPVELRITSADVIHSFWVPSLAGKIDAMPQVTNFLVLEADSPGTYPGQCAEFCGLHHANMRISVVAMEEAEFRAWLKDNR